MEDPTWSRARLRTAELALGSSTFVVGSESTLLNRIRLFWKNSPTIDSIAAAIGEERDAIEEVYEPFLIQKGFIMRTPRGRVATNTAYQHFGLEIQVGPAGLFDNSD